MIYVANLNSSMFNNIYMNLPTFDRIWHLRSFFRTIRESIDRYEYSFKRLFKKKNKFYSIFSNVSQKFDHRRKEKRRVEKETKILLFFCYKVYTEIVYLLIVIDGSSMDIIKMN